jgi:hypothetical protein
MPSKSRWRVMAADLPWVGREIERLALLSTTRGVEGRG